MAKTACEDLAHYLEGHFRADISLIGGKSYMQQAKRLRSEARELERLRKWSHDRYYGTMDQQLAATVGLQRMADRIQKARNK